MSNIKNVPEIRFKGCYDKDGNWIAFTHPWEQRKLNEIAKKVTEKNKDNLYDEPLTNSAEQGIISQKDYFDREVVNEENLDGYYVVQDNDFVYNPRVSVTAPVGPINRNKLGRNGVMSPLYTVFRTHDIDTCYLEYYFKTTSWHRFMKLNGDSGARFDRFSIASSLFMEMPIPYPCMDEQERIGEYFQYLDNLITLHQRKVDTYEKLKICMSYKLFNQVLRFKADDGSDFPDWEEDIGCNRINIINGKPFDSKEFTTVDNGNPIIRIRDLDGCTITLYSTEKYEAKYKVKKGDILIGMDGDFSVVKWNNVDVGLNQRIMHVIGKNDYMDDFMYHQLRPLVHEINVKTPFSTVKHLSSNTVLNMKLLIPCLAEQQKIAKCLSSLDGVIESEKAIVSVLKKFKKGMLQKMFV